MVDVKFLVQSYYSRYYVIQFKESSWEQHYIRKDGTVGNYTELTQKPDLYCWGTKENAQKFATLLEQRETLAQEILDIRLELHDTEIDLDLVEKELKAMTEKTPFKKGDKFVSGLGNKYIVIGGDRAVVYESNVPHMLGKVYSNVSKWINYDWYQKIT